MHIAHLSCMQYCVEFIKISVFVLNFIFDFFCCYFDRLSFDWCSHFRYWKRNKTTVKLIAVVHYIIVAMAYCLLNFVWFVFHSNYTTTKTCIRCYLLIFTHFFLQRNKIVCYHMQSRRSKNISIGDRVGVLMRFDERKSIDRCNDRATHYCIK